MKNKVKIIIISAPIIFAVIYFIFFYKNSDKISTLFIAEHPEEVSKINIKKDKQNVLLTKMGEQKWIVNEKYPASDEAVKKLHQTLTEVKIDKPVPKEKNDSVLNELNTKGTLIILYNKKGKILREWLIGKYENSAQGTYIKEKDNESPYIVNIPGLENDLNYRYNPNLLFWIDPKIFSYEPNEIKEIEITNTIDGTLSYKLNIEDDEAHLFLNSEQRELKDIGMNKVGSYLSYFMDVKFSSFPDNNIKDSVIYLVPDYIIKIKDIYDSEKNVKLFRIKTGNNKFDPFKLHALINDEDLVIVNYTDIDLIIKEPDYFTNQ